MENTSPNFILDACSILIDSHEQNEYIVAFSGGEDSSVLLHAMVNLMEEKKIKLRTIHINHNLQENAKEVSAHCAQVSKDYAIEHFSYEVKIEKSSNIEETCRVLRYSALSEHSHKNEIILTAHHLDDQIETFFLRVLRGSALKGLSSMDTSTMLNNRRIVRPLLGASKSQIQSYSKLNKISFIDDKSNYDIKFDRNFIRSNIIPKLKERWISLEKIMSNNIDILALQSSVLDNFIDSISKDYLSSDKKNLYIDKVNYLDFGVKVLLLHRWIYRMSATNLNLRHINEILKIMNTNNDSNPLFIFDNVKITKIGNKLIIGKS